MNANIAPHTQQLLATTDEDGFELSNVTLTISEALVDYYLQAAGVERGADGGFYVDGARIAWELDEAVHIALAIVATYR